ncbi:MAG TPA: hypothetical protein ENF27_04165 [Chloroflexi bacterium]|nr:MAG: hypothetical protein DRI65_05480 [Chloroflexota bacterium]HDN05112.1 hypothetical protein [Chloroflexota bacterium]
MQIALLVFIVVFALAIGFFLGLFLLSMNSPLLNKLFQKDETTPEENLSVPGVAAQIKKPSPNSRLVMQVWKEEGKPPVYDLNGSYVEKENLPRDILNIITVQEKAHTKPEPLTIVQPPIENDLIPPEIDVEEEGEPEVKMLSVIDEVNEILQKKLHGSPLAGKGIHLMENHNKEIRFWVGLNSYNDAEEIPDAEVRQIIDASVREWEESRE